jgi:hypothetical protein
MTTKTRPQWWRAVTRVHHYGGLVASDGAKVLTAEMELDPFVGMMVQRILATDTPQTERAETLCRLLGSFGVGTIVHGRMV